MHEWFAIFLIILKGNFVQILVARNLEIMKQPYSLFYMVLMMKDARNNYVNKWAIKVKQLLEELGFALLWTNQDVNVTQLNSVFQRIYDQHCQKWFMQLNNSSRWETYCNIKDCFETEKIYLCQK